MKCLRFFLSQKIQQASFDGQTVKTILCTKLPLGLKWISILSLAHRIHYNSTAKWSKPTEKKSRKIHGNKRSLSHAYYVCDLHCHWYLLFGVLYAVRSNINKLNSCFVLFCFCCATQYHHNRITFKMAIYLSIPIHFSVLDKLHLNRINKQTKNHQHLLRNGKFAANIYVVTVVSLLNFSETEKRKL